MSSTNKTDLGLNQWVLSDKPTMHDFNEDNRLVDEMLQGKVDGNWRVYTSLEELELVGDVTMVNVATTLPFNAELHMTATSAHVAGGLVPSVGLLTVKVMNGRRVCTLESADSSVTSCPRQWMGYVYTGSEPGFTGWREVVTASPDGLARPVWTTLPTVGVTSSTLKYTKEGCIVWVAGMVTTTSAGAFTVATMPVGFRPSLQVAGGVAVHSATGNGALTRGIAIHPTGVMGFNYDGSLTGSRTYVVSFCYLAEQ